MISVYLIQLSNPRQKYEDWILVVRFKANNSTIWLHFEKKNLTVYNRGRIKLRSLLLGPGLQVTSETSDISTGLRQIIAKQSSSSAAATTHNGITTIPCAPVRPFIAAITHALSCVCTRVL